MKINIIPGKLLLMTISHHLYTASVYKQNIYYRQKIYKLTRPDYGHRWNY